MPMVVLITGHFSDSAEMSKFLGKGQIPRLGSKYYSPRKTVGPSNQFQFLRLRLYPCPFITYTKWNLIY